MADGIKTGDPCGFKDVVRSSVKVPEFDKQKKAEGHIGRNVVEITINMKTIIRKPLMKVLDVWLLITLTFLAYIYQTPPLRQDLTQSIFKRSLTGLN